MNYQELFDLRKDVNDLLNQILVKLENLPAPSKQKSNVVNDLIAHLSSVDSAIYDLVNKPLSNEDDYYSSSANC